jgi:predicted GNAT family acetyltransferase
MPNPFSKLSEEELYADSDRASSNPFSKLSDEELYETPLPAEDADAPPAWREVLKRIPTRVRASVASTIAGIHAAEFAKLERAARAGVTLASPEARSRTPEETARILASEVDAQLNTVREAQADMQPLPGETTMQRGVSGAAVSAPTSAAALAAGLVTRNPAIAAATMLPATAGQNFGSLAAEYQDQAEKAGTPLEDDARMAAFERAAMHAQKQGAIEVGTELMPLGALLKPGTPALQRFISVVSKELVGETVATVAQSVDDVLARSPEGATVAEVMTGLLEGGKQLPETWVATLLLSGTMSGTVSLAEAGAQRGPKPPDDEPKESDGLLDELEKRQGAEDDAGFIAAERERARQEVAARGGDLLEQELAASKIGARVGAELDAQTQRIVRMRERADLDAKRIAEQEAYANDQAKEDAARARIQQQAAVRYETAPAHEAAERDAAAARQAQEDQAYYELELRKGQAVEEDAAFTPTLADVAPAPLKEGRAVPAAALAETPKTTIRAKREARRLALPKPGPAPLLVDSVGQTGLPEANQPATTRRARLTSLPDPPKRSNSAKSLAERRAARIASKPARVAAVRAANAAAAAERGGTPAPAPAAAPKKSTEAFAPAAGARPIPARTFSGAAIQMDEAGERADGDETSSYAAIKKKVEAGEKLEPLTLYVSEDEGVWQVEGHDGRHRALVIRDLYGDDAPVPVNVVQVKNENGKRRIIGPAPDLAGEQLLNEEGTGLITLPGKAREVTPVNPKPDTSMPEVSEKKRLRDRRAERRFKREQSHRFRLHDDAIDVEQKEGGGFELRGLDSEANTVAAMEVDPTDDGKLQIKLTSVDPKRRGEQIGQQLIERAHKEAAKAGKELVSDRAVSLAQLRAYDGLKRKGWTIEYAEGVDAMRAEAERDGKRGVSMPDGSPVVRAIRPPEARARLDEKPWVDVKNPPLFGVHSSVERNGRKGEVRKVAAGLMQPEWEGFVDGKSVGKFSLPATAKNAVELTIEGKRGGARQRLDDKPLVRLELDDRKPVRENRAITELLQRDLNEDDGELNSDLHRALQANNPEYEGNVEDQTPRELFDALSVWLGGPQKATEYLNKVGMHPVVRAAAKASVVPENKLVQRQYEKVKADLDKLLAEPIPGNVNDPGTEADAKARTEWSAKVRKLQQRMNDLVDKLSPPAAEQRGVPIDEARAAAKAVTDELPQLKVTVLGTLLQAPKEVLAVAHRTGVFDMKAVFMERTGEIFVFADQHKSADDVVRSVLHEGVAHFGLRALFGDQLNTVLADIARGIENKVGLKRVAKGYELDLTKAPERLIATEEYIAKLAEDGDTSTFLQRVIDAVRAVLRKIGLTKKWTDNDIRALLRQTRKKVAQTDEQAQQEFRDAMEDGARFNRQKENHPLGQLYNMAATAEAQMGAKRDSKSLVADAIKNTSIAGQRPLLGAIPRQYLSDFVSDEKMPAVAKYVRTANHMDGRRNELLMEAEPLGKRWASYIAADKKNGPRLAELMQASTLTNIDPSKSYKALGDPAADAKRKGDYDLLRKHWEKLGEEGRRLFGEIHEFHKASHKRMFDALEKRINDAQANGQTKKALIAKLREQFETGRVSEYYAPLMRFGDYWAAAKDKDGNMVSFVRFESPSQQRRWVESMKKQGLVIEQGQKTLDAETVEQVAPEFAARITELVKKSGDTGLADEIWQMYLATLPELSMRKAFMHRKGRLGFSADALRAFGHAAFHGAHQTARLEHMHVLEKQLADMRNQAAKLSNDDDPERYWATNVYTEMVDRHEWAKNPKASSWATGLTSFGFAWYLSMTPAAAMVNLTQTPMVALPVLSAEYGFGGSAGQLLKAGALWASSRGPLKNRLRGDERRAFEEAERTGLFEKTQAHDLAGLSEEGIDYSSKWRKAAEVAAYLFHKTESANREVTFLAAYRLAREKGATHDEAIHKGEELTWRSHFDYSNTNRPRYIRGDIPKVFFLFKNYSLHMSYRLIRDFNDSIRGATPEAKKQARVRFGGMFLQSMLLSGLSGLPVVWTVARLLESMFDEEDDPYDAQEAFYAHLADQYGGDAAMAIMRGPIDWLTGGTLSTRVSLSQLWFREPDASLEPSEVFSHYLGELAGPIAGIFEDATQAGVALSKTGDPLRAMEYLTPKAIDDQLKWMRFMREGALNFRGEEYMSKEEFSNRSLFLQALGFTPSDLQQRYDEMKGIRNTEARILGRRQALMDQLFVAARTGDQRAVRDVMAQITQFNTTNPGGAITADTIINSANARRSAAESTLRGVRLSIKELRYLHEQMRLTKE